MLMKQLAGWIQKSKARPQRQKKKKKRSRIMMRLLSLFSLLTNLPRKAAPLLSSLTHKKRITRLPTTAKQPLRYYLFQFDLTAWKKRAYHGHIDDSASDLNKKDFSQASRPLRKSRSKDHPVQRALWPALPQRAPPYTASRPLEVSRVMLASALGRTITTVLYTADRADQPWQQWPSNTNKTLRWLSVNRAEKNQTPQQHPSITITLAAGLNAPQNNHSRWGHSVTMSRTQRESIATKQPVSTGCKAQIEQHQNEKIKDHRAGPLKFYLRNDCSRRLPPIKKIYAKWRHRRKKSPLHAVLRNQPPTVYLAYVAELLDEQGQNGSNFSVRQNKQPYIALPLPNRRITQLTHDSKKGRAHLFRTRLKRLARQISLNWPVVANPPSMCSTMHRQQVPNLVAISDAHKESTFAKKTQYRISPCRREKSRPYNPRPEPAETDIEWYDDENEQNSSSFPMPQTVPAQVLCTLTGSDEYYRYNGYQHYRARLFTITEKDEEIFEFFSAMQAQLAQNEENLESYPALQAHFAQLEAMHVVFVQLRQSMMIEFERYAPVQTKLSRTWERTKPHFLTGESLLHQKFMP